MTKTPKRPRDVNQLAKMVVDIASGELDAADQVVSESDSAAKLGRLGGLKGGAARAQILSPEQRKKIAQKAASARWRSK